MIMLNDDLNFSCHALFDFGLWIGLGFFCLANMIFLSLVLCLSERDSELGLGLNWNLF